MGVPFYFLLAGELYSEPLVRGVRLDGDDALSERPLATMETGEPPRLPADVSVSRHGFAESRLVEVAILGGVSQTLHPILGHDAVLRGLDPFGNLVEKLLEHP